MKGGAVALGALLALGTLATLTTVRSAAPACRISEYPCRSGKCVRLDRYCDGVDDCGDNSDEPKFCTGKTTQFFIFNIGKRS
jgi:hypothetical protein